MIARGRKKVPGQRSNITLLVTSFWTILGLFILIVGHLAIVFYGYGKLNNIDALTELAQALPALDKLHLYVLSGLAIAMDIWILFSHKKEREHKIRR